MKKTVTLLLVLLCAVMVLAVPVRADTGPKASVHIQFENMGDALCYGTLLSQKPSTGPASVWNGEEEDARHSGNENYRQAYLDYEIWKAFVEYEDPDGYYFLQESWEVSLTEAIHWTYYPPSSFKILLYYPESGTFVSSGIYEKYAFDTYYTVDMDGVEIGSVVYDTQLSTDERIQAYRSYNYTVELLSLAARILITIAIEMLVGLIFGFRRKKQVLLLLGVNTVTQVLLNTALNVINYCSGQLAFVIAYVLLEILVFVLEAVLYCIWMRRVSEKPRRWWFYALYALVANALSFSGGLVIAQLLPGIF